MDDHHHQNHRRRQLLSILTTLLTLTLIYLPIPLLFSQIAVFLILLFSATLQTLESKTADEVTPVGSLHFQSKSEDEVCSKSNLLHFQQELENGVCSKSNIEHEFDEPFVEWDVRAPLDVIYEEESEDDESDKPTTDTCLTRYSSSLANYFPETDTDTTSSDEYPDLDDCSSPSKICYKWDEDDANELIEIELESKKCLDFELEDSMFEIDISPASWSRIPTS